MSKVETPDVSTERRKRRGASKGNKRKGKLSKNALLWRRCWMIVAVLCVIPLVITAYAGYVSPITHSNWWGAFPLAFPLVFWIDFALMLLFLLWCWRASIIIAVGFLCCAGPALSYCPLHFTTPRAPEGAPTFSLMSYNVLTFKPMYDIPDDEPNPTLQYILDKDDDIVCLQECYTTSVNAQYNVTSEQIKRLHEQYPVVSASGGKGQVILSKYPIENLHVDPTVFKGAAIAAYRVSLPCGRVVTIFNIHLKSMLLSDNEILQVPEGVRNIVGKIRTASVERARQINKLMQTIRQYGGPEVIVCGDFNDVTDSYSVRTLADANFRDAYVRTGFGPIVTYNAFHLLFTIDHVLYRGALKPLGVEKGYLKSSDHYPLTVNFAITDMPETFSPVER